MFQKEKEKKKEEKKREKEPEKPAKPLTTEKVKFPCFKIYEDYHFICILIFE